jgi:hypothetical protein
MARNYFKVEGMDEFAKALARMQSKMRPMVKAGVDDAGDLLLAETKRKVPAKSGKLKNSLFLKRTDTSSEINNVLTWGDDVRKYAAPVELGHGLVAWGHKTGQTVQAKPFLRPAADEKQDEIFKTITNAVDKALEEFRK